MTDRLTDSDGFIHPTGVATGATTRRELIAAIAALLGTRGSGYTQAREDGSMFGIVEWKHFGDLPPEVLTIGDAVPTVMVAIYRWNEPKAWHVSVHCEPDEVPR